MGDESGMIKIGPVQVCRNDEMLWDEKGHDKIVQIFVFSNDFRINSIQFQYVDENGSLVLSQRHGDTGETKFDVVRLNHPKEYITWISGQTNGSNLCSITFGTNKEKYGPFGPLSARNNEKYSKFGLLTAGNKDFCFKLGEGRQFGGFYGTVNKLNGTGIRSIGLYLNPNITLDQSRSPNVKVENA